MLYLLLFLLAAYIDKEAFCQWAFYHLAAPPLPPIGQELGPDSCPGSPFASCRPCSEKGTSSQLSTRNSQLPKIHFANPFVRLFYLFLPPNHACYSVESMKFYTLWPLINRHVVPLPARAIRMEAVTTAAPLSAEALCEGGWRNRQVPALLRRLMRSFCLPQLPSPYHQRLRGSLRGKQWLPLRKVKLSLALTIIFHVIFSVLMTDASH